MSLDVCLPAFLPSSSSSFSFILILLRFGVLVFAIDSKANGNGLEVLGVAPSSYGIKWVSGDRDLKRLTWAVSRLSWNGKPGIRPPQARPPALLLKYRFPALPNSHVYAFHLSPLCPCPTLVRCGTCWKGPLPRRPRTRCHSPTPHSM